MGGGSVSVADMAAAGSEGGRRHHGGVDSAVSPVQAPLTSGTQEAAQPVCKQQRRGGAGTGRGLAGRRTGAGRTLLFSASPTY